MAAQVATQVAAQRKGDPYAQVAAQVATEVAKRTATQKRKGDPYGAYRFRVEIRGIQVAGFSEIRGLEAETEVEEYREGGVNGYVHRFPGVTRYPPLVMKRGITGDYSLWEWYAGVNEGNISRKQGAVILLTRSQRALKEVCRWSFNGAYPVKWIGPEFSSSSNEVAVETLEIIHNGLKLVKKPD
ncbi:MAG: phage tail protein [Firmicutes bacterium]|nr:phage tail protein [Bacillota bacterium]